MLYCDAHAERFSISAFVDPDDHEHLVERARLEERSVSAALRLAIRRYRERTDDEKETT